MARLLRESPPDDLRTIFSPEELYDVGDGPGRAAGLAARFAAKEACLKLFPRETSLALIGPEDFAVTRDGYGAPRVICSPRAQALLDRHRCGAIALSLTHDKASASAVAVAEPIRTEVPLAGKLIYHLLPIRRRIILTNLRRVFGDFLPEAEIRSLAQAHYAHLARLVGEFLAFPWLSPNQQGARGRVENIEAIFRAHARGKGVLVLTGHFGNWEVATAAVIANYPQYRGRIHFVRRPLHPAWLDALVTRRFRRAGFGVLPKKGSLNAILDRLAAGDVVVFVFDQHASGSDGIPVEFFGQPAGTFRSLAIIALATGAPVVPATCWREPDGRHVLRFEEALPPIECEDVDEAIRRNTRTYNAALERLVLRHPEQWFWVHRRWKHSS
ncbi:MAG: 4'-phosphopantetheinyl transferase superfamily protein [candidate division NC10 bacterium]|nr:4'-phosphopantetheinyl transferase superfamily protein [candidate division NC10 bacterium]